ncbi:hypothetical protein GLOIN_2v1767799 [Rhizophagus irregularis DAOM 181602=DAOM 197198]|uniref:Uncharacterized protein n=1 Tax=Rhizophagus irregularis (strain DAOM 181602 / DAOM 197198 / MUCL 43194) TaxID=747089 RepID=A0A2P4QIN9_RHIID|nr:hypothetical protein GLOIN_2v1767799 [Rhizophagus irregularis DAOM 181602=DAOM 197198]POG77493.1 hypothetical protein GLOIN_2v1767799 [Rhizophagus irregularis DAOM 181602=DAOM 197198]GBC42227.2 hypothetical protein GLOIN_2v1767799 [Rhizophagus irregularis DAOM 181602=DAOM 197198]|eukprot:XP_025184359.1 hypothetical protein GLOIN_2v1767799 [Rhizophagus irregularis DAOM 181602=DAOM 197198]
MGFEDGMSYQDKLPWQNASQLDRQNQDDGSGEVFLLINSDFGGRRGDNMVHVQASICNALWFLGNYFKGVERVAKGLATDWVPWILRPDVGTIEKIKNGMYKIYSFKNVYVEIKDNICKIYSF